MSDKPDSTDQKGAARGRRNPSGYFQDPAPAPEPARPEPRARKVEPPAARPAPAEQPAAPAATLSDVHAGARRAEPAAQAAAHDAPPPAGGAQHETSDMGLNILVAAGAIIGGLIVIALIVVALLTNLFRGPLGTQSTVTVSDRAVTPPAAVEMRVNPVNALDQYLEAAHETLNSYGWVDKAGGVARIPIARAMLLVTEGLGPAVSSTSTPTPAADK